MTAESFADAFGPPPEAVAKPSTERPVPVAAPHVAGEVRGSRPLARLLSAVRVAVADVRGMWAWFCRPPTLAELVAARVPDRESVPGGNLALWAVWVGYNHLLIVLFALVYPALFALAHPARVLLATVLVAPLIFVWI